MEVGENFRQSVVYQEAPITGECLRVSSQRQPRHLAEAQPESVVALKERTDATEHQRHHRRQEVQAFPSPVMVFSPESGYKFTIEIQKACTDANEEVWKLLFDLYKKAAPTEFVELVSVVFVAGDPNDVTKVAAITDEGMKRPQVRAFREDVFPPSSRSLMPSASPPPQNRPRSTKR